MNFDFPTILLTLAVVAGAIWACDALFLAPRRRAQAATSGTGRAHATLEGAGPPRVVKEPLIVEYSRSFFPIILIVLILRSFVAEPFRIPSGSMMPTLLAGDFILVNKFEYGIRLPVINKKIIDLDEPKRGDVVVFRFPNDPSVDYIKRVVGLPGDHIAYRNKVLYINDGPAPQVVLGPYRGPNDTEDNSGTSWHLETLGDVEHEILIQRQLLPVNKEIVVPQGHYYVMGDNRDRSNDSRFWGSVPEENLVGKAFMIWMNWDCANSSLCVDWSRIGDSIE